MAWALLRPPACTFYRLFLVCLLTFNANYVTPYCCFSSLCLEAFALALQPCQVGCTGSPLTCQTSLVNSHVKDCYSLNLPQKCST